MIAGYKGKLGMAGQDSAPSGREDCSASASIGPVELLDSALRVLGMLSIGGDLDEEDLRAIRGAAGAEELGLPPATLARHVILRETARAVAEK